MPSIVMNQPMMPPRVLLGPESAIIVAARQGGQMVTKWFLVPIPFILKED